MSGKIATIAALAALLIVTTFTNAQTIPALIACWDMEESSGIRYDITSNNLDLTDNNTVTAVVGLNGNAANLVPGNNESLSSTNQSFDFDVTGHAYYVITKHGTTNASQTVVMSKDDGSTPGQRMTFVNGQMSFRLGSNLLTATGGPANGNWTHLFVWANSGVVSGQINTGSIVSMTSSYSPNNHSFNVGAFQSAGVYYDGAIDTFAVFSEPLESEDRTWLYNNGNGRTCSEIVAGYVPPTPEPETGPASHVYTSTLPVGGGVGTVTMDMTAGDAGIIIGIALVVLLLFFEQLSSWILATAHKRDRRDSS